MVDSRGGVSTLICVIKPYRLKEFFSAFSGDGENFISVSLSITGLVLIANFTITYPRCVFLIDFSSSDHIYEDFLFCYALEGVLNMML